MPALAIPLGYDSHDVERLRDSGGEDKFRNPFARDLDRLLYTRAFRRLQGKTQVVTPGEADFFRTRLTHTLEVAQVARRLAQVLNTKALELRERGEVGRWDEQLAAWVTDAGVVDPDLCEAASVLHDLGHPPFGHAGERALAQAMTDLLGGEATPWDVEEAGSFDGNAQSFRLACRALGHKRRGSGLELTRAVIDASLKYPHQHGEGIRKWSVYPTEADDLHWVRLEAPAALRGEQTFEAQIMDWADDIAYSVHDVDDWFHAGFMPIPALVSSTEQLNWLSATIIERWRKRGKLAEGDDDVVDGAVRSLFQREEGPFYYFIRALRDRQPVADPGSWHGREAIRAARSALFGEFLGAATVYVRDASARSRRYGLALKVDEDVRRRCDILRELLWIYVVGSPRMATQQAGQQHVVAQLLARLAGAAKGEDEDALDVFPLDVRQDLSRAGDDLQRIRLVVDFVSGMTDAYALRMHARLTGGETRFLDYV